MKPVTAHLPDSLFKEIRKTMPVLCVALVVTKGKEFFLVKRLNKPDQGNWFFPGGRIYKNERLETAAKRKLKEESGLRAETLSFLGFYEYFAPDSVYPKVSTHTVDMVFHAPVKTKKITVDDQSSEGRWFTKIEKDFHPELKQYLKKIGFT